LQKEIAVPPLTTKKRLSEKEFWSRYLKLRARYRLGALRSPWTLAFVKLPMSLGFAWYSWLKTLAYELLWHTTGQPSRKGLLPPFWLALIPGFHALPAYYVAHLLKQASQRTGRSIVSPGFAMLVSLFPPLGALYLQRAVNRYWRLVV